MRRLLIAAVLPLLSVLGACAPASVTTTQQPTVETTIVRTSSPLGTIITSSAAVAESTTVPATTLPPSTTPQPPPSTTAATSSVPLPSVTTIVPTPTTIPASSTLPAPSTLPSSPTVSTTLPVVTTTPAASTAATTTAAATFPTALPTEILTSKAVSIIVDPALLTGIRKNLTQFEEDLAKQDYTVIERVSDFKDPTEVRAYLGKAYTATGKKLAGTILIGKIPYAYQYVVGHSSNPTITETPEELISYQYYSDLDGVFSASAGYISPGKHQFSYDTHTGNLDWEIWVGVLPYYKGDLTKTVDAINRYFVKNHAFRSGQNTIPQRYMEIDEHDKAVTMVEHNQIMGWLVSGQYSWTPFSMQMNALLYFDSTAGGLTVDQGYAALRNGVADVVVTDSHGWQQASGKIDIKWVESGNVKTLFYFSNGCAVGNLDYADNFLTSMLYSPTSSVLIARGSTNNSGGMGTNVQGFFGHNIATAWSQGKSYGDSIIAHVNVPLMSPWSLSRELHMSPNIILGDPTLKVR